MSCPKCGYKARRYLARKSKRLGNDTFRCLTCKTIYSIPRHQHLNNSMRKNNEQ
jgi:DNA-directed RNA polymerase subunit RPC12/RpoP